MIEIALALLVLGIGLVTTFTLFPQGLDSSRKAVEATEAGTFAEYVFASLQSDAMEVSRATLLTSPYELNLTHALEAVASTQPVIRTTGAAPPTPEVYHWTPGYFGEAGLAPWVEKYQFTHFTYTLDIAAVPGALNSIYARLEVWPGDRSIAYQNAVSAGTNLLGSTVFYREYLTRD